MARRAASLIAEGLSPTIQQLTDPDFDAWFTSGKVAVVGRQQRAA